MKANMIFLGVAAIVLSGALIAFIFFQLPQPKTLSAELIEARRVSLPFAGAPMVYRFNLTNNGDKPLTEIIVIVSPRGTVSPQNFTLSPKSIQKLIVNSISGGDVESIFIASKEGPTLFLSRQDLGVMKSKLSK